MKKILFVCWGNICRSPMAEFILKDLVEKAGISEEFEIASGGTSGEEIRNGRGNPVYPPAKKILAEHGISCEEKRARQITRGTTCSSAWSLSMCSLPSGSWAVTRTTRSGCC